MKADLRNIRALCDSLGNPHRSFQSIHVGGTNGKGSTTAILTSVFMEHGLTVGTFTSPHYLDFRERIRINGNLISKKRVLEFVNLIQPQIKIIQPSFFELTFAMACWHFQQQTVDIAVIEVGLGGRLDSTNIIEPLASVITNIGLDHQQFLGDTLEDIAGEKAGIIKENTPVIIGKTQQQTEQVFRNKADEQHAPIHFADQQYSSQLYAIDTNTRRRMIRIFEEEKEVLSAHIPLLGNYQKENVLSAYATLQVIKKQLAIDDGLITKGFEQITENIALVGRWQIADTEPFVITDSAHNEEGVITFFHQLTEFSYRRLHIIYGCVADKKVDTIERHFPGEARIYLTEPSVKRKMPLALLYSSFSHRKHVTTYPSVKAAYEAAKQNSKKNDVIVIIGSIFILSDFYQI